MLDDFDRALENVPPDTDDAWVEGVRLVERKLRNVLEAEGVTPIEAAGLPFDPMSTRPSSTRRRPTIPTTTSSTSCSADTGCTTGSCARRSSRVANNPKEH